MKQRLISAFFGVILLIIVILSPVAVINICVLLLAEIAIHEMLSALKLKEHKLTYYLSMLMPIVIVLSEYYTNASWKSVIFIYLLLMLVTMVFKHDKYTFSVVSSSFTAVVFITTSFLLLTKIRAMDNGLINLFLVLIGSWITDSCAYFAGRAFGKHKLAPTLSPKKTVEGSIGGILGTIIVFVAYGMLISNIIDNVQVNFISIGLLGLICGIVSQIGDLSASAIKREQNIKDFGNLMPGHGGVMDRFDSVLFVAPTVFYFITNFPVFLTVIR
ncbi:MAG: phosphatidate cytidylyltransferase [Clostridia bacterium]|nr:phosphatidate cytidylyltransferase [Clostridia bacterium]